jgi:hypothetical protein
MLGISLAVRYQSFLLEETAIIGLATTAAFAMQSLRAGPFGKEQLLHVPSIPTMSVVAAIAACIDFAAAALTLMSIERRRVSDVVKGEFT